ncbi:uncharacterized protein LOC126555879 [Aphis gossypii]|uniref:uncharacterized protein LOC126555879 n=1 Tax=Aphis gossypii TaxID=80765 RepID=UPI0021599DEE|nr:uncharacterized protein LOC126555879 [Aphis gossypii]
MSNISGPTLMKRRLLASVVEIQLLYAAPIWSPTMNFTARTRVNLRRPQRAAALRTIRAYRTVSDDAAFLLAGMPPVDLIAAERVRVKAKAELPSLPGEKPPTENSIKRIERKTTITEWKSRWFYSRKAPWTHRLIPDLARWINRTVPKVPWSYQIY